MFHSPGDRGSSLAARWCSAPLGLAQRLVLLLGCALVAHACSFDTPDGLFDEDQGPGLDQGDALDMMGMTADQDTTPTPDMQRDPVDMRTPDMGDPPTPDMTPPPDMPSEDMDEPPVDMGPDLPAMMLTMCDGQEVDLLSDPAHCGQCGNTCDEGFGVCSQGTCGCDRPEFIACGPERECVDKTLDARHCGGCGFGCGPGAACEAEQCVCRPGFIECNGECVDPETDPFHCGGCDVLCESACRSGSCRGSCRIGDGECGSGGGKDACLSGFDLRNDLHCRGEFDFGCGDVCAGNEVCVDPSLLRPNSCVSYRPGRGCTECPCDDCREDDRCVEDDFALGRLGTSAKVICVEL